MDDKEFHELVKTGSPEEVKEALENGANVDARDESGKTPLMYVAEYGEYPEVLQLLTVQLIEITVCHQHI